MARRKSLAKLFGGSREEEIDHAPSARDAMPAIEVDGRVNYAERRPIILVLDDSSSMEPVMDEQNAARRLFYRELRGDPDASLAARIMEIAVNTRASIAMPWTDAINVPEEVAPLSAGGTTALGAGIALALDEAVQERDRLAAAGVRSRTPLVFVMSDGAPTDLFDEPARRMRQADLDGTVRVIPIAIGDAADIALLRSCCDPNRPVVKIDPTTSFAPLFIQMSKVAISASRPAGSQVDMGPFDWAKQV